MEIQINFCKLCLNALTVENLKSVDDNINEMLAVLLLKRNCIEKKEYLCNNCSKQIFKAFDFKATCLYIENKLVPYITSKETLLDLKEIYLKEQSNQQVINLEENQRICRLCFQPINGKFTSIDEVEVNTFNTFIPEVNFNFTKDPVICQSCFDSLGIHSSFIENCPLSLEENDIKNVCDDKPTNTEISVDSCIKNEDVEIKLEDEMLMEMGDVDVKLESSEEDRVQD